MDIKDNSENLEETVIIENTVGAADPAIATTDENLSINGMFQASALPSLAKQIFSVLPINGPTGALFNIRKKTGTNDFELIRGEVSVYPSTSIATGLTQEAVQDLEASHGKEAANVIGKLLRGLANDVENTNALAFLNNVNVTNAIIVGDNITLVPNAETNLFAISQKVQEKVLEINNTGLISYEAFAVLPYKAVASIMALSKYAGGDSEEERGLFITKIGQTKYYMNPDPLSTVAYVGLRDSGNPSKSSAIFSPYTSEVVQAVNSLDGAITYHIFNRYAITSSPLSVATKRLIHKFNIV